MKQLKDIKPDKMFAPVVICLFLCNIEPYQYVHYYYLAVKHLIYREQYLAMLLNVAVNSSVNLPTYYFKGSNFGKEVKSLFSNFLSFPIAGKTRMEKIKMLVLVACPAVWYKKLNNY